MNRINIVLLCTCLILFAIRPVSASSDFEVLLQKSSVLLTSDPDSALSILQKLEKESSLTFLQSAKLQQKIGNAYYNKSNVGNALMAYEKALTFALKTDSLKLIAELNIHLGNCHVDFTNFSEALKLFEKAHQIYLKLNTSAGLGTIYNSMGILYLQQKNYKKSEEYYKEALTHFEKINDVEHSSSVFNNLGLLYLEINKFDLAEEFLLKGYREKEKLNNLYVSAATYTSLIKLYLRKKDYNNCEKFLDKLRSAGEKLKNDECIALYYLYSGMNHMNIGKYAEATALLIKAEQIITPLKIPSIEYKIQDNLVKCYEKTGNYVTALDHSKKLKALNDSILNTEKVKQVTRMEALFESQKKEYEITMLEKDKNIAKTRQLFLIILIITLTTTGVIIIYILRKSIKRNQALFDARDELARVEIENSRLRAQKLEEDLELTSKELTTYTLNLIQKNNHLQELRSEVEEIIIQKQKSENVGDLNKIRSLVNSSIQSDHEWDEFKLHFEKVNRSFFDHLLTQYPQLTPAEVKLCALTWLNLNIKDVASLLNITPDSVKTARHRLRKKLNLSPDDNLYTFLQRF